LWGLVFHLKIIGTIQQKGCENTDVRTDDIRPKVWQYLKMTKESVYTKIKGSTKTAYDAIQNQVSETIE
jgi:hypothetical protein